MKWWYKVSIGSYPTTKRILKDSRPPQPRYSSYWDVNTGIMNHNSGL